MATVTYDSNKSNNQQNNGQFKRGAKESVTCINCGLQFIALERLQRKYCSWGCRSNAAKERARTKVNCKCCGIEILTYKKRPSIYCSKECSIKSRFGINGEYKQKKDYLERRVIDGKLRTVHRYLIEKKLGRKLKPKEIVHHIDMDNKNNTIENLYLCCNLSEHNRVHRSIDYLVKELLENGYIKFEDGKYVIGAK